MRINRCRLVVALAALAFSPLAARPARADIQIGTAAGNYAVLFEGGGNNTLQITNVTTNTAGTGSNAGNGQGGGIGNIGVGGTGLATVSGPSTINGSIDFSAMNTGQFSNNNSHNVISGGVNYNVSAVTTALSTVNSLNTALGSAPGTSISIGTGTGNTLTIAASAGMSYTLNGTTYQVFNVTGFNTTNGETLTISGTASSNVVLNFEGLSANFNNQVALSGLTANQVLYNFVGGSNLTGGPTLQVNNNANNNPGNVVYGLFLDPNGAISVTNANIIGRVFGGDTHDFQYVSGSNITAPTGNFNIESIVPEPSSLAMVLGIGGLTGLGCAWRRWRSK